MSEANQEPLENEHRCEAICKLEDERDCEINIFVFDSGGMIDGQNHKAEPFYADGMKYCPYCGGEL